MKIEKYKQNLLGVSYCLDAEIEEVSDKNTVCKLVASMIRGAEKIFTLESREDHDFDDPVYSWLEEYKDGKDLVARANKVPELDKASIEFCVSINGSDVNGLVSKQNGNAVKIRVWADSEQNANKMETIIKQFVKKLESKK